MQTDTMLKVDKATFSVATLSEQGDERAFWREKSVYERLQAIELVRQVVYGYKPATGRFQRFFEIAELEES